MLQYSCLENPLPDRESWQATVYRLTKSWTRPKWLCAYRCKTSFACGGSAQWELGAVAQLLGLRGPWHQVQGHGLWCHRSYRPIKVFFQASYSWWSEGLFGPSFSVATLVQALRGLSCLGSFSAVWWSGTQRAPLAQCIRWLMGQPLCCSAADAGLWGDRGYGDGSTPTRDSAVSPCFHACLAFLLWHFPPLSPPPHPFNPSLHN